MANNDGMAESQDPKPAYTVQSVVASFLDTGNCSDEQRHWLEQALRTDDEALRLYLEMVDLDARLQWVYRGGLGPLSVAQKADIEQETLHSSRSISDVRSDARAVGSTSDKARHINTRVQRESIPQFKASRSQEKDGWFREHGRLCAVAVSIAAALILSTGIMRWWDSSSVGELVQTADAQWSDVFGSLSVGSRVGTGKLSLSAGVAEIELFDGTRLVLEGPVSLDIDSAEKVYVDNGCLSVFVAPKSVGYTVESPDAKVVDLGTAFQVRVSNAGTEVHVIQGEVVASSSKESQQERRELRLKDRNAVRISRSDGGLEKVKFEGEQLNLHRNSPLDAVPVVVTGDIRCLQKAPDSLLVGEYEHDEIMLFMEQSDAVLLRTLYADLNAEGEESKTHGNVRMKIPAGAHLNSYLLHYDPLAHNEPDLARRASGTIRFRSPIVGVFMSPRGLYTSDKYLGNPQTVYSRDNQIGNRGSEDEVISFSPDHKAITVEFQALKYADQIRIVTADDLSPQ